MLSVFKHRRGFTLLELLISAAIIAIITTVMFGDYVKKNQAAAVRQGANQIVTDMQKMYTYAQAGHQEAGYKTTGYGLSVRQTITYYFTFFDRDDEIYPRDYIYSDGTELLANRKLPADTRVQNITIYDPNYNNGVPYTTSRIDLMYQIPGATLTANRWAGPTATTARMVIKVQHTKRTSLVSCVSVTPILGVVNLVTCP